MKPENFEREYFERIAKTVKPYSEMEENEKFFLSGLIRLFRPAKILELGVSSGGGSAVILNAIRDIDGAKLFSVDYRHEAYRHPEKPAGFLVSENFPELSDKWKLYTGCDVSSVIEEVGGGIDMLILDTRHIHPWESLNFLCAFPFMKRNSSWTVLHDICVFRVPRYRTHLAGRILWSSVVSEHKISPSPDWIPSFANIGAFTVSDVTEKYIRNVFEGLLIPWGIEIPERDIKTISGIIERYYNPELCGYFHDILGFQEFIRRNPPE